ncbi:site-specific integrase [Roseiconus nitratireducens]|uniref:Site-specific integrase n=1 Tax=Roseiconus nitratireducens TaxID=2605748 RepID=A0A5M6CTY2_9BACT|nr:site-specific integrase [Roseiconus nitratireducens]KAA5538717.1 site-specific integrase [Roseiconus nitratireducens]
MTVRKGSKKPRKPRPDYPLYANGNGQWCKKVEGRHKSFGPWDDPDGAERAFLDWQARQRLGVSDQDPNEVTVDQMVDQYLDAQQKRVKRRADGHTVDTLSPRTFREQKRHVLWFADAEVNGCRLGRRAVSSLRALDFAAIADLISPKLGVDSIRHRINYVNGMFNWARINEVIDQTPNYGTRWRIPTDNEVEIERTSKPDKVWPRDRIRELVRRSKPTMAAMIYLGINAAFGNSDIGRLRLSDIEGEWLSVPRGKNGRPRKAWLWPETRAAIAAAIEIRPEPRDEYRELLFLTSSGGPWTDDETFYDGVGDEFRELKRACGFTGKEFKGIHFYALRHSFATVSSNASGSNDDDVAIKHVMGHLEKAQLRNYRRQIANSRIKRVCQHVLDWWRRGVPDCYRSVEIKLGNVKRVRVN